MKAGLIAAALAAAFAGTALAGGGVGFASRPLLASSATTATSSRPSCRAPFAR